MRNLLLIPGPIEVSPTVVDAFGGQPASHLAPHVIEAHGRAIENMRHVWCAGPDSQPFIIPGSGTLAMDIAAYNVCDPGENVLLINTGYFSDRMATMLERRGVNVTQLTASVGRSPSDGEIAEALHQTNFHAVFATHVDTSTGVRTNAKVIAKTARETHTLSVFDGVCATAGETFLMEEWGADVYLTASQKAIGLPPGLALMVASERAIEARKTLKTPPPLSMDWQSWQPIMRAYEARQKSYFATPATNHILALDSSLAELVREGMPAVFERHASVAQIFRDLWRELEFELVPDEDHAANTLSAVYYSDRMEGTLFLARAKENGLIIAGGLHPDIKARYFRVGHMGYLTAEPELVTLALSRFREIFA